MRPGRPGIGRPLSTVTNSCRPWACRSRSQKSCACSTPVSTPERSCWAEAEGGQGPGGVAGVVAAGGGDAGVSLWLEDSDCQVAQGGHDLGAVAGADLGGVFAVGDVADVVEGFDAPVAAHPSGDLGGGSLVGAQAGAGVTGFGGPSLVPGQRSSAASDLDGLGGVREGDPGGHSGELEGAPLGAAVTFLPGVPGDGDLAPGQGFELGVQAGLVVFDGQDVVRVLAGDQELGVLA